MLYATPDAAYVGWGRALLEQGCGDEASAMFRKAVELNPENADANAALSKASRVGRVRVLGGGAAAGVHFTGREEHV